MSYRLGSIGLFICVFVPALLFSQDDLSFRPSEWEWNSSITGTISHVSFKNWAAGGEDYSYVAGLKMRIDPTWSSDLWSFSGSWDGRFSTFGGRSLPPRKTEDRFELNLKFGRMIWQDDWMASSFHVVLFGDLHTQFLPDYDFIEDPHGTHYTSNFMAPGWVTDGIGLDFRSDSLNLSIVVTPLASKQMIVLDRGVDRSYYGLGPNQNMESSPGAYARITLSKEIFARTSLSIKSIFFADYSEKSTVDMSFLGEVDYHLTSFLKLYVSLQMLNDDDMKVRLYTDLDGDGDIDDFAGIGQKLQLYGQFGVGINVSF
ncbi:MAG: DUF3078 domain-containing protein [Ignavibacteriae bacterium]|nr:MAG: DUF3078 domain-containing protein [Ignavibacteriota bacterium]